MKMEFVIVEQYRLAYLLWDSGENSDKIGGTKQQKIQTTPKKG